MIASALTSLPRSSISSLISKKDGVDEVGGGAFAVAVVVVADVDFAFNAGFFWTCRKSFISCCNASRASVLDISCGSPPLVGKLTDSPCNVPGKKARFPKGTRTALPVSGLRN